jgi:hypothetical protein
MGRVVRFEGCPRCIEAGRDRRKDNLAVYSDGSSHCFANCGYHRFAKGFVKKENQSVNENKDVLPFDFSRTIPAEGWRWLLQYGLPYTYWLPYVGYSEATDRLIVTVGSPPRFSIGRYIGDDARERARNDPTFRKWRIWGDRHSHVEVLGEHFTEGPVVLVEDIISAHKVGQVATCIPLFGTKVLDSVLKKLIQFKRQASTDAAGAAQRRPVVLWLDEDQYTLLPPKINRLQTFIGASVRHVRTDRDPKALSLEHIKEILNGKYT